MSWCFLSQFVLIAVTWIGAGGNPWYQHVRWIGLYFKTFRYFLIKVDRPAFDELFASLHRTKIGIRMEKLFGKWVLLHNFPNNVQSWQQMASSCSSYRESFSETYPYFDKLIWIRIDGDGHILFEEIVPFINRGIGFLATSIPTAQLSIFLLTKFVSISDAYNIKTYIWKASFFVYYENIYRYNPQSKYVDRIYMKTKLKCVGIQI